ncbi:YrvL family regulatory protein [Pseudogracilibacillus sp. SE30717A]|uniref:YrvL family regulatory protein n=1 Tax=Pseudogracilibacillus sp. SE30717A TaxID=3098293 RepID=UPI00300E4290
MDEENNDSFKDMNLKEKTVTVIGISLLLVIVIGFIFSIFFFGFAGIFQLLGVHYDSIWSLVIFVVSFFILGFIVDLIVDAMAKITVKNVTGSVNVFLIQMLFGFASNWFVLFVVDEFINGITLSFGTKLIIALLLGLIDPIFDNKKE